MMQILRTDLTKWNLSTINSPVDGGAIIKDIVRIERPEKTHFLFEDADFSVATIKKLIRQGKEDTDKALATRNWNQ